jgi:SAM-dependent methyltransferase
MTKSARIAYTPDGRAYLHIWRTGQSYEQQKGALYRREWTNVLFSMRPQPPQEHDVRYHDVRKKLLFADNTFDAAYALHIVEHLTPAEATIFAKELYRLLKPGGIVRISTPDLEDICRSYLRQLEECRRDSSDRNMVRYRWAVIEPIWRCVRRVLVALGIGEGGQTAPVFAAPSRSVHPRAVDRSFSAHMAREETAQGRAAGIVRGSTPER